MSGFYRRIEGQVGANSLPPLDRWSPDFSGDIDIKVDSLGRWFHEGRLIERNALVALFARILRREADGQYYLLTPQEKWRIQVADHPLRVVAVDRVVEGAHACVRVVVNNDLSYKVCVQYPLFLCPNEEGAYVALDYGVTAKLERSAWYQLCEWVESDSDGLYLASGGEKFRLS